MMQTSLQIVTPPAIEPVTVELVKQHTRVDNDADDNLVALYLTVARTMAEQYLNRALITQTLLWTLRPESQLHPVWHHRLCGWFDLPRGPVQSIMSVNVTDHLGNLTSISPATLPVVPPARLIGYWANLSLVPAQVMIGRDTPLSASTNAVFGHTNLESLQVQFTAGYGSQGTAVPAPILQAIMLHTAMLYEQRGDAGGDMPTAAKWLLDPFRVHSFGG